MKLSDLIAHYEGELARADYIDNTARMLAEKRHCLDILAVILPIRDRRASEIRELVG